MECLAVAFEMYRKSYTPDGFKDTVLTPQSAEQRFREMTVLVAENEAGEVIGTAAYQVQSPGEGYLRGMAVHPLFQGKGVAEQLLSTAEAKLRELGCSRVRLDTTLPLKRAIRFYCRNGYEPTGVVGGYFGMELFEYAKNLE
jgi:GNAT superfamily N-acetyltransferase